jgi:hypothetical protein
LPDAKSIALAVGLPVVKRVRANGALKLPTDQSCRLRRLVSR